MGKRKEPPEKLFKLYRVTFDTMPGYLRSLLMGLAEKATVTDETAQTLQCPA